MQILSTSQKRAALTIISVALGADIEAADRHAKQLNADRLDHHILNLFRKLPDSEKRGVLTLLTKRAH